MIDICMALDQSVSPQTGVRTIQNTGVFLQAVFQSPRSYFLFWNTAPPPKLNLAPTQYRQLQVYLKDFKNIYLQPYDFFPLLHEVFPLTNFQLRKKYFKNQLSLTQLNSIFMAYRQNIKTESIRKLSNFSFQWTKPCTRIITRNIFHTFRGL